MILIAGNKVLIVHRKLFPEDATRYFIGTVEGYESGTAKVTGHSFGRDQMSGEVLRKSEARTKIFSIASGTLIVYQLPDETNLSKTKFTHEKDGRISLSDGKNLFLDLTENITQHPARP